MATSDLGCIPAAAAQKGLEFTGSFSKHSLALAQKGWSAGISMGTHQTTGSTTWPGARNRNSTKTARCMERATVVTTEVELQS